MSHWQTKSSKVVYENPWIIVHEDEVVMPDGKDGVYGVVKSKSGSVHVVPVDNEGNTWLIQQESYPLKDTHLWQCVAGRSDGEPDEVAAKRELLEEAGLEAKKITVLSDARVAVGIAGFQASLCLAEDLTENKNFLDESEAIETIKKVPLSNVTDMILNGEIIVSESIAALLTAIIYLEKRKA